MSEQTHIRDGLGVDELWVAEWAAEGIAALEAHLAKQAAFAEYLRSHGVHSDDGDRRPDA